VLAVGSRVVIAMMAVMPRKKSDAAPGSLLPETTGKTAAWPGVYENKFFL